jgi:hypothetical protein
MDVKFMLPKFCPNRNFPTTFMADQARIKNFDLIGDYNFQAIPADQRARLFTGDLGMAPSAPSLDVGGVIPYH